MTALLRERRDSAAQVQAVVRLALGLEVQRRITDDEWPALYDLAMRERVGPLVWLRSGPWIRSVAPASVVALWRSSVLASMDRTRRVLDAMHECVASLRAANIGAIVLKGPPLAQMLYDDSLARPIDDIDLFIPASERGMTRETLLASGWRHVLGEAPWHESFERDCEREPVVLELHSRLVGDNLGHLTLPAPDARWCDVGGQSVPTMAGDLVAVYLAGHLAQHERLPLLWLIDFAGVWRRLPADAQQRAESIARNARLGPTLAWARSLVALLDAAAAGDAGAMDRLGFVGSERRATHVLARQIVLARRVDDVARLVLMWLWPRAARVRREAPLAFWVGRARRVASRLAVKGGRRFGLC